jgi:hypothetical protein
MAERFCWRVWKNPASRESISDEGRQRNVKDQPIDERFAAVPARNPKITQQSCAARINHLI